MKENKEGRRRFLKETVALAGLAVGAAGSASSQTPEAEKPPATLQNSMRYGDPSRYVNAGRSPAGIGSGSAKTPLQDSIGIITPSGLHYVVSHFRNGPPVIDPGEHRLLIHGMVDRPLIFTVDELKRLPAVSRVHFVECAGNSSPVEAREAKTLQDLHGWTSCSEWTGVPLSLLLREAGLQNGASWVYAESADAGKHSREIPLEKALDDVLVAYGQNGEPVRPEQGFPLRLLVPGWEGNINVKWLRRIKVLDQSYPPKMEITSYSTLRPSLNGKARYQQFEMGLKSIITFPSIGGRMSGRGFYEISGLAWSGRGSIRKVEVSIDGGRTWKDAQLQNPIHPIAHTRFRLPWNWDGEDAVIQSRCTDDRGDVQPALAQYAKIWGGVEPEFFKTAETNVNHFNAIQPVKVTRQGEVFNALF